MHHDGTKPETPAVAGRIKYAIAGLLMLGSITVIALPHFAGTIPANSCSLVHASQGNAQAQQIEWLNLKTENRFVVSYHVVAKHGKTVSVLIKQKLDDRKSLAEIIESLKYTDQVYGSHGNTDYPSLYKEYHYSIYAEDIDCSGKRHTIKSETRYDIHDNIIITNTYSLQYDINDTDLIARLYKKFCS